MSPDPIRTPGVFAVDPAESRLQTARVRTDDDPEATLRPRRLDEFVGQEALREQLAVSIAAAAKRGEALDHVLLAGPPGLGKTSLAQIVAAELDVPFVQTAGPALERKADIAAFLTALEPRTVFFVDEIHRLPRAVEETFYPAMEDRQLPITVGAGRGRAGGHARPAAVHARRRHHALRPADDPAARPLRHPAPARPLRARRPRPDRGPQRARAGDRDRARRRAGDRRARPRHPARGQPAAQARARLRGGPRRRRHRRRRPPARLDLLEVDHEGLDRLDREILGVICRQFGGGPVGLSTLAVAVQEESDTIEDVYEPYLLQRGFLQRTPRGRCATPHAFRHLGLRPPENGAAAVRLTAPDTDRPARDTWVVLATRVTSTRLIGRTAELAELEAAFAAAADGHPSIAFVAGESGVGKSRLVSELSARAKARGARTLCGECVELGEGELPYAPLVAALRPLSRDGDPVLDEVGDAARAELATLLPELGARGRAPPRPDEGAGAAQRRLFEALLALLERLGREDPVLLLLEDIHWADSSTRAFLAFVARAMSTERVLAVCTYRSDELHRRHPLRPLLAELERDPSARRIELARLSRAELSEQLADILDARARAPTLVERLYGRSEGNPLFAEELLAAGGDGRGALPPTLRDALMVRTERLPEAAQEVLRVLAVAQRADHALLADASGLGRRRAAHGAARGRRRAT